MLENVLILGEIGRAVFEDEGHLFVLHLDSDRPIACRAGDVSLFLDSGAEAEDVEQFPSVDRLREELRQAHARHRALSFVLSGLDPDFSAPTRTLCIEAAEELCADPVVHDFVRHRLLARPLPEVADITAGVEYAKLSESRGVRGIYEEVAESQEGVRAVHEAWLEVAPQHLDDERDQLFAEKALADRGIFAAMTAAGVQGNRQDLNNVVFASSVDPALKRQLPRIASLLTALGNSLISSASLRLASGEAGAVTGADVPPQGPVAGRPGRPRHPGGGIPGFSALIPLMPSRTPLACPPHPILALRVGVTGHRRLPAIDRPMLDDAVVAVLSRVAGVAESTAANPQSGYARPGGATAAAVAAGAARLVVVSALAEGADRLVAELALEQGFHLHAPLPCPAEDYAHDFETEASRAEFVRLLARASRVLELDGRPAAPRPGSAIEHESGDYRRLGTVILSNSDILLAVWDGVYTGKSGGTSQVVVEALRVGIPVVWIPSVPPHAPVMLEPSYAPACDRSTMEGTRPGDSASVSLSGFAVREAAALRRPLGGDTGAVVPDAPGLDPARTKPLCDLDGVVRRIVAPPKEFASASRRYFKERRFWKRGPPVYASFRRLVLIGRPSCDGGATPDPVPAVTDYAWADHLASLFATFYRSAFVANYVLAALAVVLAVAGGTLQATKAPGVHGTEGWPWAPWAVWAEFITILAIVLITLRGKRERWHEQWLQYRLLAEHFRQVDLLSPLGRTAASSRPPTPGTRGEERWITWLFRARVRDLGMQCGRLTDETLQAYREGLLEVIASQGRYHQQNAREQHCLHRRLHRVGITLFSLTLLACFLHLAIPSVPEWMHPERWKEHAQVILTALAACLPALGTAAVAISGQAEYVRTARRSEWMADRLEAMGRKIPENASSEELALLAEEATELMGSELHDWHLAFRVRPLDLPA